MQFKQIETERLFLRAITPEVMDFVFDNYTDSGLMDFFNHDEEQLEVERDRYKKGYTSFNKSFLYFQLIDKKSNVVIGWCGYHTWYFIHFRAELGYGMTNVDYREQGLMREALKAIIDYGFNEMKLNRVEAFVADYNMASLKTIARLNFKEEGRLVQHYLSDGNFEDSLVFALLQEDYEKIK